MAMKHTPGPWRVKRWPAAGGAVPEAFSIEPGVARVYYGDLTEANARLIAAAPELLEMLKELVEVGEESWKHDRPCLRVARELIARIKGDTE